MDELKRDSEWGRALRAIAEHRDHLLGTASAIPPARRAILGATLAREFPTEAALRGASTRQDQMLSEPARELPPAVARDLRRSLTNAQREHAGSWRYLLARPALLAASLIAGLGIIFFEKWGSLLDGGRDEPLARDPIARVAAPATSASRLLASRNQFSLRMSATELASLRATFLASNPASFEESAVTPTRLRLDLPVRALLRDDDGIASTP